MTSKDEKGFRFLKHLKFSKKIKFSKDVHGIFKKYLYRNRATWMMQNSENVVSGAF